MLDGGCRPSSRGLRRPAVVKPDRGSAACAAPGTSLTGSTGVPGWVLCEPTHRSWPFSCARPGQVKLCFHLGHFERCSGSQWNQGQIWKLQKSWQNGGVGFHTALVISWRE